MFLHFWEVKYHSSNNAWFTKLVNHLFKLELDKDIGTGVQVNQSAGIDTGLKWGAGIQLKYSDS